MGQASSVIAPAVTSTTQADTTQASSAQIETTQSPTELAEINRRIAEAIANGTLGTVSSSIATIEPQTTQPQTTQPQTTQAATIEPPITQPQTTQPQTTQPQTTQPQTTQPPRPTMPNSNFANYIGYEGTNQIGSEISSLTNSSFSTCKKECDNNPFCEGFNFQKANYPNGSGTCWLKNDQNNIVSDNDWNLFVKIHEPYNECIAERKGNCIVRGLDN